jgi:hypothetical protein
MMKRTTWATMAMSLSFLLGTIIALGSLISMGGHLDTASLMASPLNVPTILVSCLDPLTILLELVAIVLIVMDSKQVGTRHRYLAWTALIFFIVWSVLNVGVFLPLSFIGAQRGSLKLIRIAQMVKAGAGLLQYNLPFLLVYEISRKTSRVLLWAALILTVVGNFGVVIPAVSNITLEAVETTGQTVYAPRLNIDYRQGIYPILLGAGYTGGALYMAAYGWLTVRLRRHGHQLESEREVHPAHREC